MSEDKKHFYVIEKNNLPENFPTHRHEPKFFELLGRAVATFGFLEEVLAKAIFSFSATRPYKQSEINEAYNNWLPMLERTLSDPLGNLIKTFKKSVCDHPFATITNLDELITQLEKASKLRNVICHGSWRIPDSNGASVPFFVNRQQEVFETAVDCKFLTQLQKATAELACEVISTVTHLGWQFPGSNGPGKEVYNTNKYNEICQQDAREGRS
jgi:hypothetical protein